MKYRDPISRVFFYSTSQGSVGCHAIRGDADVKPMRHKVFVFWNPEEGLSDVVTLQRLTGAFEEWAMMQVEAHETASRAHLSPMKPLRRKLEYKASCPISDSPF